MRLALVAMLWGCTGSIVSPGDVLGEVGGFGTGGTGASGGSGSGAGGSGSGSSGSGGGTSEPQCSQAEIDEPGRVTLRRLNRFEYNATVRDLLADSTQPANAFPADDFGRGYDNLGEVLSTPPLLVEKWQAAAEALTARVLQTELTAAQQTLLTGAQMTSTVGAAQGTHWNLVSNGTLSASVSFAQTGMFTFKVQAFETHAGTDYARMRLSIDGTAVSDFEVRGTSAAMGTYTASRMVTSGNHQVQIAFLNDFYAPPDDRNLIVASVEVSRPGSVNAANAKVIVCDPLAGGDTCVRDILTRFGRKAWRRPLDTAEVNKLFALVQLARSEGDDTTVGLGLALQAVLLSPHFLYRPELNRGTDVHALSEHELAARLSYFIWGSMPDPELSTLADNGQVSANLAAQARRMVQDPKASALVTQFAGSWLWSRAVEDVSPSYTLVPAAELPALKAAMKEETERFVRTFLEEDRSSLDLLGADYTFLNDTLARHYGLPLPGSTTLTRVTLSTPRRGSILGHGGILTVTSQSNRTSPVKRGKWVLAQLLCREPPPPPPGVEALQPPANPSQTLRERMELHRRDPVCAACHKEMDPIGFSMENYDAVGRWRDTFEGSAIDASGTLPDGRTFNGPAELGALVKADPRLSKCMAEQLTIYALGRDVNYKDHCAMNAVAQRFEQGRYRLPELVVAVTQSRSFTHRRPEAP